MVKHTVRALGVVASVMWFAPAAADAQTSCKNCCFYACLESRRQFVEGMRQI
jgi:hypothetical protein